MNHYPHHIGDFNNGTRHLTRIERSIYRDLIELYYDTEAPLNGDIEVLQRRIIARSEEEKAALVAVLGEFFTLQDGAYFHARCDEEVSRYKALADRASKGASKRWGNKHMLNDARALPKHTTSNANQNQEPEPRTNIIPPTPKGDWDEEVVRVGRDWAAEFEAFWAEYPETRKKNRYRVESAWSAQHHLPPKNELQEALRAFKASPEWKREGGKFIPAPETWIMERRWQDAPAYSPKPKPAPKSEVDEADAFAWRREVYPESLEVHPCAKSFPFKIWPESIRAEYRNRNNQLQAA